MAVKAFLLCFLGLLVHPGVTFAPQRSVRLYGTKIERCPAQVAAKKPGGIDEGLRSKLVSESIAPWRTVRLFMYFALGSGAFIGGLITLTGFAAALSKGAEVDTNAEVGATESWSISGPRESPHHVSMLATVYEPGY